MSGKKIAGGRKEIKWRREEGQERKSEVPKRGRREKRVT